MNRSLFVLAGLGSAFAFNVQVLASPDSALPAAPSSINSGNGNFGGTEIRREQQRAQASASKHEEANEKTIQLSEVPQAALEEGQRELANIPTAAKVVNGTNPPQYELEAKDKYGKEIAVHVLENGTILKKE